MSTDTFGTLPAWAIRIREERNARDWSVPQAVKALITHATDEEAKGLPSAETLKRRWHEWEAGDADPSKGQAFYAPIIARTFGTALYALFPLDRQSGLVVPTGMETVDILARIKRSDVDGATLEALARTVEMLCSEYPYMPSEQLVVEGRQWLRRVVDLRGQRLTFGQYREILVLAGWLSLLVGCVENDMGDRRAAEATRKMALSLGEETGNGEIIGWAHEMRAWFALTDGDYRGVIAASKAGAAGASNHSVAVQLLAQEAKAWARIGDRRQMEVALDKGRTLLDSLPYPENLDNHFVVDPAKFDFYAMDCYRLAGADQLAGTYANEVIRTSTSPNGLGGKPMRAAEAEITLGIVAGRGGDVEAAVAHGEAALAGQRKSLPSLLMVSSELGNLVNIHYPKDPAGQDYLTHLRDLRATA